MKVTQKRKLNNYLKTNIMHRLEKNILHHAKQRKEQRKYLRYSSEKQNGVTKRVYFNADGSVNSITYN